MQGTPWGDDALDTAEAAEYLNIYRSTLYQRYKEWGIPFMKVGGTLVFLKPDLDKFKARRTDVSGSGNHLFRSAA